MRPPTTKLMLRTSCSDLKRAGYAQRQPLIAGLNDAGRPNDILGLQCGDQCGAVDAETGELLHREFDEDPFVLRAQNLDLGHVRDLKQLRANVFDMVAKFAMGETVGREAEDDPECVAEIVVEARPDDPGRKRMTNVADALADVVPDVGDLTRRRVALQVDEDRCNARAREAAQKVELRRFLQLAFDPLGDLFHRLFDASPRARQPARSSS